MKRSILLLGLIVLMAYGIIGCGADRANLMIRDAVDASRAGDMVKYKDLVIKAHDIDPENVFIINNRGTVYEMDNDKKEAVAHYKECIEKAGDIKIGKGADPAWEGKPLKDLCAANLKRVKGK